MSLPQDSELPANGPIFHPFEPAPLKSPDPALTKAWPCQLPAFGRALVTPLPSPPAGHASDLRLYRREHRLTLMAFWRTLSSCWAFTAPSALEKKRLKEAVPNFPEPTGTVGDTFGTFKGKYLRDARLLRGPSWEWPDTFPLSSPTIVSHYHPPPSSPTTIPHHHLPPPPIITSYYHLPLRSPATISHISHNGSGR